MIRYLLSRIGCMMVILGSMILALGIAAESSGAPAFELLFIGGGLSFVGILLWNKLRTKQKRSTRFSLFRRREQREERQSREEDDGWDNRYYD